ncbi:MAG: restriction endonuclease subunit S, partial [Candidatus Saccharibacteria bacterium]|nr:restriction endonuclease subunit S [Candidatus Saccharibacteria bacterium]
MSKIDDLIKELCPDGVEAKELGDIAIVKTGQTINKAMIQNSPGGYPVVNSGKDPLGYYRHYNTEDDPIGVTSRGAGVGSVTWYKGRYFRGNLNYSVTIKEKREIMDRYIFHLLLNNQSSIQALATYDGIPALNASNLKKLLVPLPPLEVQKEIVRVLDSFTELEARKKQYEYYRNELLNFDEAQDGVRWRALGEVCRPTLNVRWDTIGDGIFRYVDLSSVSRDNNSIMETVVINKYNAPSRAQKIISDGDVIFGTTRPLLRRFCIIPKEYDNQICSTGFCVLRPNKEITLTNYIYYYIGTQRFYSYVEQKQKGTSYPAISDNNVRSFKIPIPSMTEQQRIVNILDKFEKLTNDISVGLPAEIEARRKQYEYYRNKLLTF